MNIKIKKVAVLGLGKVGSLVALFLQRTGMEVVGFDVNIPDDPTITYERFQLDLTGNTLDTTFAEKLINQKFDAYVSCLPFHLNKYVAEFAHFKQVHYFDLTEDVETTKFIQELAKTSKGVMIPQCGLAPGLIGIIGVDLMAGFDSVDSLKLRVGAIPKNPTGKLGYALNWSPEGVINEYINDCEAIVNGEIKLLPAMEGLETIFVNGIMLEAFNTSGGLGTMCETYKSKIKTLNYKTMRYPGHCELMKFLLNDLQLSNDRETLTTILKNALPAVNEDFVFIHASVVGTIDGKTVKEEFVRTYPILEIGMKNWSAIAWTTAASACSVIEMVSSGVLPDKGFVKQEDISFDEFLQTVNGSLFRM